MLRLARVKIREDLYSVVPGSAYALPFRAGVFSGGVCAFGIRNMHDTAAAVSEICRVMKKESRMVFLEFSMPEGIIRRPYGFYLRRIRPCRGLFSNRERCVSGRPIEGFTGPTRKPNSFWPPASAGSNEALIMGCVYIYKAYKD
jgi:demethylmenaquinone methyltransferase/2-methoxy-6-polyprenyl-1,4-benzoquinol methylase